jgi:hypothetical protein
MVDPEDTPSKTLETRHPFIGSWIPVDLHYAHRLHRRGLLDWDRVAEPDPHCRHCGHRAVDHGFDNLPVQDRRRWFTAKAMQCGWPGCPCSTWQPLGGIRNPTETAGLVRISDSWIEVPLGRAWIVAYRIVNDRGTPVVGELRVFPAEEERPDPGQWSGVVLGTFARVPRGGITSRQLRGIRVRAYLRDMAAEVARFSKAAPDMARDYGWWTKEASPTATVRIGGMRRGRKGRSDAFYADIAREYTAAVTRKSLRPIGDIARRRRISPGQVRDMVRQARKRGLLTLTAPGVRGGILTERARALLQARKRRT